MEKSYWYYVFKIAWIIPLFITLVILVASVLAPLLVSFYYWEWDFSITIDVYEGITELTYSTIRMLIFLYLVVIFYLGWVAKIIEDSDQIY